LEVLPEADGNLPGVNKPTVAAHHPLTEQTHTEKLNIQRTEAFEYEIPPHFHLIVQPQPFCFEGPSQSDTIFNTPL